MGTFIIIVEVIMVAFIAGVFGFYFYLRKKTKNKRIEEDRSE